MASADAKRTRLLALGNGVWLDEIRNEDAEPIRDVPGGSVTFATLGARLFVADDPSSIHLVFNAGHDFPNSVVDLFRAWAVQLDVRHQPDKLSARGLVFYSRANSNRKGFQRLTEPLPVTIKDLDSTNLQHSEAFHFFGTAEYIEQQTHDISDSITNDDKQQPFIIWEPHAKSCRPDTLQVHRHAARFVDVFSPNHEELAGFFAELSDVFDKRKVEKQADIFIEAGIGHLGHGCIVVRAAGHGCLIKWRDRGTVWLPSYYDSNSNKVVDPTGAGNAFLGAFAIGWQETGDYVQAAMYGQVAASFAIEQVGLAEISERGQAELWNGSSVRTRLETYRQRLDRN